MNIYKVVKQTESMNIFKLVKPTSPTAPSLRALDSIVPRPIIIYPFNKCIDLDHAERLANGNFFSSMILTR